MLNASAGAADAPLRSRQTWFWVGAYVFAGFLGLVALLTNPSDSKRLLLVLDRGVEAQSAWPLLDDLDAELVAVVAPRIILVESTHPILPARARARGALLTFDGSALRGCGPATLMD
ncbi:hypothetical protein [Gimibacter soli]|uniref:Uncharacterized protein n=1 Tax=Gimibacter soli TaxID=3024400 RepID=A0AAF0BMP1_9PROT|nr:hypothetical protein [Gimibacter soli]WCL54810.1 hypothetical protein PH603_03435 [Gimibacter soli]